MREQLEKRLTELRQQRDGLQAHLVRLNNDRDAVTAQLNGTIGAMAEVEALLAQVTRKPLVDRPAKGEGAE